MFLGACRVRQTGKKNIWFNGASANGRFVRYWLSTSDVPAMQHWVQREGYQYALMRSGLCVPEGGSVAPSSIATEAPLFVAALLRFANASRAVVRPPNSSGRLLCVRLDPWMIDNCTAGSPRLALCRRPATPCNQSTHFARARAPELEFDFERSLESTDGSVRGRLAAPASLRDDAMVLPPQSSFSARLAVPAFREWTIEMRVRIPSVQPTGQLFVAGLLNGTHGRGLSFSKGTEGMSSWNVVDKDGPM